MKYFIFIIVIFLLVPVSANAMELQAPSVPESGAQFMPENTESFADGLVSIMKDAISAIRPSLASAATVCLSVIVASVLCAVAKAIPGSSGKTVELVCTVLMGYLLFQPSDTLIQLASDTIVELSNYGKLLLPVLTAALAANGGVTKSAALYAGTAAFDTVLCTLISSVFVPMVYILLAVSVASNTIGEIWLNKIKSFLKWVVTWGLKIVLYAFTGFMGITGVISGNADALAVKATKLTISGMVPVVGGLLSDASETVLVSAGLVKNAAGVYGVLAVLSICIGPFVKIGVQYLLLKISASLCETFAGKECSKIVTDFSAAMGLLLAMTGTVCVLLLISAVCFLKGVG